MTDYTAIAGAELLPEAPLTSSLMYRLANNVLGIIEGATGAPRIRTAALARPAAGPLIVAQWFISDTESGGATWNEYQANSIGSLRGSNQPAWSVIAEGKLRLSAQHMIESGGSGRSRMRFIKTNASNKLVILQEWINDTPGTWVTRTFDVDVEFGDLLAIQHRPETTGTGSSMIRRAYVMADSRNMFVH